MWINTDLNLAYIFVLISITEHKCINTDLSASKGFSGQSTHVPPRSQG